MTVATADKDGSLENLRTRARECKGTLCRFSYLNKVSGHKNALWGQFFPTSDDGVAPLTRQFGIYGTASATAILAHSDDGHHRSAVQRCLQSLPGWDGADPCSPLDIGEFQLTLKATAVLDALPPNPAHAGWPVIRMLLDGRVPKSGWGYVAATTDASSEPEILPTAHAVVVLCTHYAAIGTRTGELMEAVEWMCERVRSTSRLSRLESAFALLALTRARGVLAKDPPRHIDAALEKVRQRTLEMTDRSPVLVEYYEHVHYQAPSDLRAAETASGQSHKGRYMFYPVDLVAAYALLEADTSETGAAYVLRVVDKVSRMVVERGAYYSAATGRAAVADALIVVRLMDAFLRELSKGRNLLQSASRYIELPSADERITAAKQEAEDLKLTMQSMIEKNEAANRGLHERAERDATRLVRWGTLLALLLVGIGFYVMASLAAVPGYATVGTVFTVLTAVLTTAPLLLSSDLLSWTKPMGKRLARRLERRRRAALSLLESYAQDNKHS